MRKVHTCSMLRAHLTRMSRVHELTDKGNAPCMNGQTSSLGVKKVGFKQHF